MQESEKKLLGIAGLVVLIFALLFGFSFYTEQKNAAQTRLDTLKNENRLRESIALSGTTDEVLDEQEWLEKYQGDFTTEASAQTQLLQFVNQVAVDSGLEVKKKGLNASDLDGEYFHSVKVEFDVAGTERALYQWLTRINSPNDLRTVTFLRVSPQKGELTKIQALVVAEQWFRPESDDASEPSEVAEL